MKLSHNFKVIPLQYFKGLGLEIGAWDSPYEFDPSTTTMEYADSFIHPAGELGPHGKEPVRVDYLTDGGDLNMIQSGRFDFQVTSHVLEHVPNPGRAIEEWVRVIRPGGDVFMAVPDKRHTFDRDRTITPLSHHIADFEERVSKIEYKEYLDYTLGTGRGRAIAREYYTKQETAHVHVWDFDAFHGWIVWLRDELGSFEIRQLESHGMHILCHLVKNT